MDCGTAAFGILDAQDSTGQSMKLGMPAPCFLDRRGKRRSYGGKDPKETRCR
jgi:hypothetical protein